MYECLYTNVNSLLSSFNYQVLNKGNTIFNGYWYNITSVNVNNEENVEVDINFVENILENYAYYTDGYYPALIPVDIQINYNNVSCSINNETLLFGPYIDPSGCSVSQNLLEKYLSNSCTILSGCYYNNNDGNYYFNATCNVPEVNINNQFTYDYYLYEFIELNNETMNNYCYNSYCYIIG